jgi:hypothetical protein
MVGSGVCVAGFDAFRDPMDELSEFTLLPQTALRQDAGESASTADFGDEPRNHPWLRGGAGETGKPRTS